MPASDRRTARIVGWLFIGTFVFSIPGYLLYGPLLDHPDYVLGGGHDTQITLGACLEILTPICNIGTAVALTPSPNGLDSGELACRHQRCFAKNRTITALEHARTLRERRREPERDVIVEQRPLAVYDGLFA